MSFSFWNCLALCFIFSSAQFSFANQEVVLPSDLSQKAYERKPGAGFHHDTRRFSSNVCVVGKKNTSMLYSPKEPFLLEVSVVGSEVQARYSAETSFKKVVTLQTDGKMISFSNPNKEAVCGTGFVSEIQIGARLHVSKWFRLQDEADAEKVAKALKDRAPNLRALQTLDLTKLEVDFSGVSVSYGGYAMSETLGMGIDQPAFHVPINKFTSTCKSIYI